MNIDPRIYYFLLGAVFLLGAIVISVVLSYIAAVRRLRHLEEKEDELYKKTILDENEILKKAQEQYQKMIDDANLRAEQILKQAVSVNDSSRTALSQAVAQLSENEKKEIEKESAGFVEQYRNEISKINTNNIEMFKSVSEKMLAEVSAGIDTLKKSISEQTFESQKAAEEKIKSEYQKLEEELKAYREQQYSKVQNDIYQILLKISKDVIGRGLSYEEHQNFIIESLDQAKKEGGFA